MNLMRTSGAAMTGDEARNDDFPSLNPFNNVVVIERYTRKIIRKSNSKGLLTSSASYHMLPCESAFSAL